MRCCAVDIIRAASDSTEASQTSEVRRTFGLVLYQRTPKMLRGLAMAFGTRVATLLEVNINIVIRDKGFVVYFTMSCTCVRADEYER